MNTTFKGLILYCSLWLTVLFACGEAPLKTAIADAYLPDDACVFFWESSTEAEVETQVLDDLGLETDFEFSPLSLAARFLAISPMLGVTSTGRAICCRGPPR